MNFDPAVTKNGVRTSSADPGRSSASGLAGGRCGPWPGPVWAHFAHPVCGGVSVYRVIGVHKAVTGGRKQLSVPTVWALVYLSFFLFVCIN